MKVQPKNPKAYNSGYNEIFEKWVEKLPHLFPSSVDAEGLALPTAITKKEQYLDIWTKLHKEKGNQLFPSPGFYKKIKDGVETNEYTTRPRPHKMYADFREDINIDRQTSTLLFNLSAMLDKVGDTEIAVGGKRFKIQELANAIRRSMGKAADKQVQYISKIGDELKKFNKLIDDFEIAIKPPLDFDPETAEENQNPYSIKGEHVGKIAAKITKKEIARLEDIFEARGGNGLGTQKEQSAYKFNFDETDEVRLKELWNNLRAKLNKDITYYTLKFEERNKPLFEALVYIFNKFGTGRSGQRYFSKKKRLVGFCTLGGEKITNVCILNGNVIDVDGKESCEEQKGKWINMGDDKNSCENYGGVWTPSAKSALESVKRGERSQVQDRHEERLSQIAIDEAQRAAEEGRERRYVDGKWEEKIDGEWKPVGD